MADLIRFSPNDEYNYARTVFNSAWIELELAHVDKNEIRETYNHAQYLEGCREMVKLYTDYIAELIKINITPHSIPLNIGI